MVDCRQERARGRGAGVRARGAGAVAARARPRPAPAALHAADHPARRPAAPRATLTGTGHHFKLASFQNSS